MGYQMLPILNTPKAQAATAIAALPATPPLIPADIGYVSRGNQARATPGAMGILLTNWRSVRRDNSSAKTGTISACSLGSTSRNQPTQLATVRTAPKTLTLTLVRSPANTNVNPNAS